MELKDESNPENSSITKKHTKVFRSRGVQARVQAGELQSLMYQLTKKILTGLASDKEKENAQLGASCIRAWSEAGERRRIALGKPLPGSLRPSSAKKPSKLSQNGTTIPSCGVPIEKPRDITLPASTENAGK